VGPFTPVSVGAIVVLTVASEVAGMLGPMIGGSRRVDGPMGKADRGIALGVLGLCICHGQLPSVVAWVALPFGSLLTITTLNRLYFAWTEGGR
jgi:CDP-diacylglycerol---glycerol-3-phosphate 3-phosphatidyltransferase